MIERIGQSQAQAVQPRDPATITRRSLSHKRATHCRLSTAPVRLCRASSIRPCPILKRCTSNYWGGTDMTSERGSSTAWHIKQQKE